DIDAIEKVSKDPLAKERQAAEARKEGGFGFGPPGDGPPGGGRPGGGPPGGGPPGGLFGGAPDPRTFVAKRTESIAAQLSGKSKGYVPTMGFGPGGPGRFGMGNMMARPLLEALDTDKDRMVSKDEWLAGVKKCFQECDKAKKGSLDEKMIADG